MRSEKPFAKGLQLNVLCPRNLVSGWLGFRTRRVGMMWKGRPDAQKLQLPSWDWATGKPPKVTEPLFALNSLSFTWCWGLNPGPYTHKASALPLRYTPSLDILFQSCSPKIHYPHLSDGSWTEVKADSLCHLPSWGRPGWAVVGGAGSSESWSTLSFPGCCSWHTKFYTGPFSEPRLQIWSCDVTPRKGGWSLGRGRGTWRRGVGRSCFPGENPQTSPTPTCAALATDSPGWR